MDKAVRKVAGEDLSGWLRQAIAQMLEREQQGMSDRVGVGEMPTPGFELGGVGVGTVQLKVKHLLTCVGINCQWVDIMRLRLTHAS